MIKSDSNGDSVFGGININVEKTVGQSESTPLQCHGV